MIPISLCIITKNEAAKLQKCLEAVKEYPFEIIVVDTGSSDDSVSIAKSFTKHVYHFDWISDFSAARNFSISKASNDWVLILDTDEYVTSIDLDGLYRLIEEYPTYVGRISRTSKGNDDMTIVDQVPRLFDRRIYMYRRPIHEQVEAINETNADLHILSIPVYVDHDGYDISQEDFIAKTKRNLDILLASEQEFPDYYTYFQIGQCYMGMHDYEKAIVYYEKGMNFDLLPASESVQLMIINYGYCLLYTGRVQDALTFLTQIYPQFEFVADVVLLMGILYLRTEHYAKALLQFIKATTTEQFFTLGSNSFLAHYYLGVVYEMMGKPDMALNFYKLCGDYQPALNRIKEITEG